MEARSRYLEIPTGVVESRPTYHFVMKCLLYSRMETGLLSNEDFYDEDVNVYIAHLLDSMIHPENVDRARRFLSPYDSDVFRMLQASKDARLRYTIYKTNADFLLLSLGIFDNPEAIANPGQNGAEHQTHRPSEEAFIGRGRTYYRFAYTYSQLVHGRTSGISDVLEKLSIGFEKYLRILAHMRGEYLDLMHRLSTGEVYHLERVANEQQRRESLREKQDAFLDLYLDWKKTGAQDARERMSQMVKEIRALDPEFRFEASEP
ncbi:MAG: hypothetical protein ACE15D_09325 [Candidatus Eisenbacteria bacterium]|nr:hypothetical protein [Candidatus Eisenbacteria bacterium]